MADSDLELRGSGVVFFGGLVPPAYLPSAIFLFTQNKGGEAPPLPRSAINKKLGKLTFRPFALHQCSISMGVARIFQRGGHTDSYRGYSSDCHLNIVSCLLTRRLTKGGSQAPQDPPPPLATPMSISDNLCCDEGLTTKTPTSLPRNCC